MNNTQKPAPPDQPTTATPDEKEIPHPDRITAAQAQTLAVAVHTIRPRWGIPGILEALRKAWATFPADTLTKIAIHAAQDQRWNTPAAILQPGEHRDRALGTNTTPTPTAGAPTCTDHPTFEAHNCRCCWADIKTGARPETHLGQHWTPTEQDPTK